MAKMAKVERPTKKSEFEIIFASRGAEKGWTDLKSTILNFLTDSWDFLTKTPLEETPNNLHLRGELGKVTKDGKTHTRWQHKPTASGDSRIWFYVIDKKLFLEQVHTRHPNQTK